MFSSQAPMQEEKIADEDDDVPLPDEIASSPNNSTTSVPTVEDVAVPKAEVVAVPNTITLHELVKVFKESERTRIPVFEGTLDHPLGFVHLKDIAIKYGFNGRHNNFNINKELRDLLFTPPSQPIDVLREDMQEKRCHMALVIDEYGGVDGLVTIEDLLEHYFGEIIDEHDTQEENAQEIIKINDTEYECSAKIELEELRKVTGLNLTLEHDEDEIDTLGGWVTTKLNRIPEPGETFNFDELGLCVEVKKGTARKMDLLLLKDLNLQTEELNSSST